MSGLTDYVTTCIHETFTGDDAGVAEVILGDEDFFAYVCTRLKDVFGSKDAIAEAINRVAAELTAETDEFGDNELRAWLIEYASSPTGWFKSRLGL